MRFFVLYWLKIGVVYMKAILINVGILLALAAMYYFDFWSLFTFKNAFWYAFGLVIIVLLKKNIFSGGLEKAIEWDRRNGDEAELLPLLFLLLL